MSSCLRRPARKQADLAHVGWAVLPCLALERALFFALHHRLLLRIQGPPCKKDTPPLAGPRPLRIQEAESVTWMDSSGRHLGAKEGDAFFRGSASHCAGSRRWGQGKVAARSSVTTTKTGDSFGARRVSRTATAPTPISAGSGGLRASRLCSPPFQVQPLASSRRIRPPFRGSECSYRSLTLGPEFFY